MFLTVKDLKEKLQEFDDDMFVYNDWGDPLIGVDTSSFMVGHKNDEDGDEVEVLELEFYATRGSVRSDKD